MAELKTKKAPASVPEFLAAVTDPKRRADAQEACALIADETGTQPAMWGTSIVGFGAYHYKYASGQEGAWPAVGLAPRKAALTLYLSSGFDGAEDLLGRLGPHRMGKSCLYVKQPADVDTAVLRELIRNAYRNRDGKTVSS